jgi:hypothetical protein
MPAGPEVSANRKTLVSPCQGRTVQAPILDKIFIRLLQAAIPMHYEACGAWSASGAVPAEAEEGGGVVCGKMTSVVSR